MTGGHGLAGERFKDIDGRFRPGQSGALKSWTKPVRRSPRYIDSTHEGASL